MASAAVIDWRNPKMVSISHKSALPSNRFFFLITTMPYQTLLFRSLFFVATLLTSVLAFLVTPTTKRQNVATSFSAIATPTRISEETTHTIDRAIEEKEECLVGRSEWWELRLFNDPENFDYYVTECLVKVTQIPELHAYQTMKVADTEGQAVIGTYSFERAEWYTDALKTKGLAVDMFPVDFQ